MPYGPETLTLVLVLRAFASGSVALTGVEAIANGVPAFKPPEARNAANTLVAMAVLLGVIFIGVTLVARAYDIVPSVSLSGGPTVIALVAQTAFGDSTPPYFLFQIATALILFLAANTSFNAFPRLAAILAEDGYFPRQFSFRGDRLAYSWGIILLAGIAAGLYVLFQGNTTSLIPLYSVGVFVCFTLSQGGMVRHWVADPRPGLAVARLRQRLRGPAHVRRPGHRRDREVLRRRLRGRDPDPAAGRDDAVHPPPVRPVGAPARDHGRLRRGAAAREERAIVPIPELNRAAVQAVNVARSISERRDGRVHHRRSGGGGRAAGAVAAPGAGRAPGRRRVAVSGPRRAARRLPRRPRPRLAAGQAGADHVRRPARVRRPQLVGADPVQPVRATPAQRRCSAGPTR